jgi:hemerythrin-like domain-containing protein
MRNDTMADRRASEPIALGAALVAGKKVPPDATQLLMEDHRTVLGWFRWHEREQDAAVREVLVHRICAALRAHMAAEERWLYPAARDATGDKGLVERSIREHDAAKDLMRQLEPKRRSSKKSGTSKKRATDKASRLVEKLCEEIEKHVREEETGLFPKLRSTELDLYELGCLLAAERAANLYEIEGRTPPMGVREELPPRPDAH